MVARPSHEATLTSAIGVVDAVARQSVNDALTTLGIAVTVEAEDVTSLLSSVLARPPMVAVVGSQIAGGTMHAVHRLTKEVPSCLVVLLATSPNDAEMLDALSAGAVGYLPRDLPVSSIATAVRAVLDGEVALTRTMMSRVVEELQGRPGRRVRLVMSSSTVRVHVSNILHKLHVTDRDAAVRVLAGI